MDFFQQWLQNQWKDPVWSKVIATTIIAVVGTPLWSAYQFLIQKINFWESLLKLWKEPFWLVILTNIVIIWGLLFKKSVSAKAANKKIENNDSESPTENKIILFCKILLNLYIAGFALGYFIGKSNSPDYNNPNVLKEMLYCIATIPFQERRSGTNEIFSSDDFYSNENVSLIAKFMCNIKDTSYESKRLEIYNRPFVFALKYSTIPCNDKEYYFDLDSSEIKERKKSLNSVESKISKQGLNKFDWLQFIAAVGAYESGRYAISELYPAESGLRKAIPRSLEI